MAIKDKVNQLVLTHGSKKFDRIVFFEDHDREKFNYIMSKLHGAEYFHTTHSKWNMTELQ